MAEFTQILKGMSLLLQRIAVVAGTFQNNFRGLDLEWLFGFRCFDITADDGDCRTGQIFAGFIIISKGIGRINDLGILETGSVIEGNEADVLAGAVGTDPALQLNEFVLVLFQICSFFGQFIQLANTYFCWHNNISPYF